MERNSGVKRERETHSTRRAIKKKKKEREEKLFFFKNERKADDRRRNLLGNADRFRKASPPMLRVLPCLSAADLLSSPWKKTDAHLFLSSVCIRETMVSPVPPVLFGAER